VKPVWRSYMAYIGEVQADGSFQAEYGSGGQAAATVVAQLGGAASAVCVAPHLGDAAALPVTRAWSRHPAGTAGCDYAGLHAAVATLAASSATLPPSDLPPHPPCLPSALQ
jgi:hypothetical protein